MSGCTMTTLPKQDEKRVEVSQKMRRGELTVGQGALLLEICERQLALPAIQFSILIVHRSTSERWQEA